MARSIVCFGELILRLTPPGREMFFQSPRLEMVLGGAEANVAVSLARLGTPSRVVTVLPNNPLAHACRDELRRHGVGVDGIRWVPEGRVAIYYLQVGAMLRPSDITYDRLGSAFAEAAPELIDWPAELEGARALHVSGITAATGPNGAGAALAAVAAANAAGVPVSFDCNYRAKMWERWGGNGADVIRELMAGADVLFGDDRDLAMVLGTSFEGNAETRFDAAVAAAFDAFPRLQTIACTRREQATVDDQTLGATLVRRGQARVVAAPHALANVVDRIGGGDAFVAGLLHALRGGRGHQAAIDFALAAAVLKHSVPGDFNLVSAAEVERLVANEGLHVRR